MLFILEFVESFQSLKFVRNSAGLKSRTLTRPWRMTGGGSAEKITLYTFPVSQLITPARLALYMGNIPFEENVIPSIESWKNETSLPLLVLDDCKQISRGIPILNYCARISGMYSTSICPNDKFYAIVDVDVATDREYPPHSYGIHCRLLSIGCTRTALVRRAHRRQRGTSQGVQADLVRARPGEASGHAASTC
jgi:hypothetical protein